MDRRTFLQMAMVAPVLGQTAKPATGPARRGVPWTKWGGPYGNFHTDATGIKDSWPPSGPPVVWKRKLGEGYSSPSVEGDVLYSMYGRRGEEVVFAADATSGKTLWEHATPMAFVSDAALEMGNGPYATPLVAGDRVFTTGVAGRLQCFDKTSGKVLWTQQLLTEHRGSLLMYGYASSPAAFRDLVIVPVGGRGKALMAFNQMFVSSEYGGGTKVFELSVNNQQTSARELWTSNRLRLHHGNAIRIGDAIYFSSGGKGSQAILSAVDAKSGTIHWQQRSIEKATFVWADNKLVTLDQDGNLMIAYPSPKGFQIAAKAPMMSRLSWTPPVLVGTRLYLRDRATLMAVELG